MLSSTNQRRDAESGSAELIAARAESRVLYWAVAVFSFFVNMLMLAGPLYMLNIYDRVLSSRSVETLLALTILITFLYGLMGILDFTRGRVMSRVGARFQSRLERRVFGAVLDASAIGRAAREATTGLRDLEAVQRLMTSPALMAVFDLPWVPLFFFGIFLFHPLMGILAVVGGAVLVAIALINQFVLRKPLETANQAGFAAEQTGMQIRTESELVQSLGMREAAFDRWQLARGLALDTTIAASDRAGGFTATTRALRLFLQSAMLGLGAYLVLQNELTPGAMIAGSILLGRALSPIELLIGQWGLFQRGREGWRSLAILLGQVPRQAERTALPEPKARLVAEQITVVPPGAQSPCLRSVSFMAEPGQAIGVIGTSGSGKSTLARVLTGVLSPVAGKIRLDGAALDQYGSEVLGRHVGYLPQRVHLFDGTIKENIARMSMEPDDAKVVAAAKAAAAHEMILKLPDGYDTKVTASGGRLSGGQVQRVGLARALYGDPVVVVLDEPNSNLDNEGSIALNAAINKIKSDGRVVFVMAHRPSAIQECDMLLVLDDGQPRAFGPRDEVLRKLVKNHGEISQSHGKSGGVS